MKNPKTNTKRQHKTAPARDGAKVFVVDTNVLLQDPASLTNFGEHDVVVPAEMVEEIDKFKSDPGELGFNAREVQRGLDEIFPTTAAMAEGYAKPQGGTIRIEVAKRESAQAKAVLEQIGRAHV